MSGLSLISKLINLSSSAKHMHQIHALITTTGLSQDKVFLSKLIEKCSKLGLTNYGYSVFKHTKNQPNSTYVYNTMIKSLSLHHSSAKEGVFLFNDLRVVGLLPDTYSFPFVLKAVTRLLDGNLGRQVHGQVIKCGFEREIHVVVALVQMYSSVGMVVDARRVFEGMAVSNDVALWNAMVAGYVGVGDMENGRVLFEGMSFERNVISWTTVIAGYVHVGRPREAIEMFRRMQGEGVVPDEVALLAALSACADLGALELGEWIRGIVDECNLRMSVRLCNALVDMYVKSGNVEKALNVFMSMESKNVVSWTTMIVGLAFHGRGREALEIFSLMETAGDRPNEITFIGILSACSHVGLVELGWSYFNMMEVKYGITPKIQHYGCMVDLLGRVGCLHDAEVLVMKMPFKANAAIWGSLLAASRLHGDTTLASKALEQLSILEPNNSGNYAILSNTYASLRLWDESREVRNLMRNSGVKKSSGESSIEINNCVHSFKAGNVSSPVADKIYGTVCAIHQQCEMKNFERIELENQIIE